ncbi:hypothetical protein [Burkholderia pseudomallei]|uniref:hypothetical protein n=1 Tax=Burkholderia pseudomallei TaxID=28450 RepID=UPI000F054040|nr:hypothetical protein [Burkholderia pseudomallei]VBG63394.1 Uncharacterised protein [Burkholderia pseudomallei]
MARKTSKTAPKGTTTSTLKAFTDRAERLAKRHPIRSGVKAVLDDIVQLQFNVLATTTPMFCALTGGGAWFNDTYLIALDEYRDHPQVWAELLAVSQMYMDLVRTAAAFTDLLSDVYGAAIPTSQAKAMAQHLTPVGLADGVTGFAERLTGEGNRPFNPNEGRLVLDPTCGTGALLLAQLRQALKANGKAGVARMYVLGNDIDPAMMKATVVQIVLSSTMHGVPLGGLLVHCADLIRDYHDAKADTVAVQMCSDLTRTIKHARDETARRQAQNGQAKRTAA